MFIDKKKIKNSLLFSKLINAISCDCYNDIKWIKSKASNSATCGIL